MCFLLFERNLGLIGAQQIRSEKGTELAQQKPCLFTVKPRDGNNRIDRIKEKVGTDLSLQRFKLSIPKQSGLAFFFT